MARATLLVLTIVALAWRAHAVVCNVNSTSSYRTIAAALASGCTLVNVYSGTYAEDIVNAGRGSNVPVTIVAADPNDRPVITGAFILNASVRNVTVRGLVFQASPSARPGPLYITSTATVDNLNFTDCDFVVVSEYNPRAPLPTRSLVEGRIAGAGLSFVRCLFSMGGTAAPRKVAGGVMLNITSVNATAEGGPVLFRETRVVGAYTAAEDAIDACNAVVVAHTPVHVNMSFTNTGGLFYLRTARAEVSWSTFDTMGVVLDSCSNVAVFNNAFQNVGRFSWGPTDALKEPVSLTVKATVSPYETRNVSIVNNKFAAISNTKTKGYAAVLFNSYYRDSANKDTLAQVGITKNDFSGVAATEYAILNPYSSVEIPAQYNYWVADASGPLEKTCNPNGKGAQVSTSVNYWNFCVDSVCSSSVPGWNNCASPKELNKGVVAVIVVLCAVGAVAVALVAYIVTRLLRRGQPPDEKQKPGQGIVVVLVDEPIVPVVKAPEPEPEPEPPRQQVIEVPSSPELSEPAKPAPEEPEVVKPELPVVAARPMSESSSVSTSSRSETSSSSSESEGAVIDEEAEKQRLREEEEERLRKEAAEAEARRLEEEAERARQEAEEARRKAEEEEAARRAAEAAAALAAAEAKRLEEEAQRLREEEEAKRRLEEEEEELEKARVAAVPEPADEEDELVRPDIGTPVAAAVVEPPSESEDSELCAMSSEGSEIGSDFEN
eukprot:m51a1_g4552 putative maltose o-acetyltransferase (721) ;mRNA; f:78691-80978